MTSPYLSTLNQNNQLILFVSIFCFTHVQDDPNAGPLFKSRRNRGRKATTPEEADDRVFFLELCADKWRWSKPLVHGGSNRPLARTEHAACKIGTNDVAVFGGWAEGPMNDLWIFNYVDMEWSEATISGIRPKPRYRHTCEVIGNIMYILGGSDNIDDVPDGCRYLGIHCFHMDILTLTLTITLTLTLTLTWMQVSWDTLLSYGHHGVVTSRAERCEPFSKKWAFLDCAWRSFYRNLRG